MQKITETISAIKNEIMAISWPTRKKVYYDSLTVLVSLVIGGALIALVDLGFSSGLRAIVDKIETMGK
jgi:preprotein translocase SecE subunit